MFQALEAQQKAFPGRSAFTSPLALLITNKGIRMLSEIKTNPRGFEFIEFEDYNGQSCSLQQSSLALYEPPGTSAIWLGVGDQRMHLSLEQTQALLSILETWVKEGSFASSADGEE